MSELAVVSTMVSPSDKKEKAAWLDLPPLSKPTAPLKKIRRQDERAASPVLRRQRFWPLPAQGLSLSQQNEVSGSQSPSGAPWRPQPGFPGVMNGGAAGSCPPSTLIICTLSAQTAAGAVNLTHFSGQSPFFSPHSLFYFQAEGCGPNLGAPPEGKLLGRFIEKKNNKKKTHDVM